MIWLLYDLAALLIVIIAACTAAKRGFMRTLVSFVGGLAALIGAYFASEPAARWVFAHFVRQPVYDSVLQNLQGFTGTDAGAALQQEMGKWAGWLAHLSGEEGQIAAHQLEQSLSKGVEGMAAAVTDYACGPVVVMALHMAFFLVFLILFGIAVGLIARAFDIFNHLPLISGANHFLGALLGVLQGCLILFLAAAVLGLLISLTGGWPGVNSEVISQSYLFNIFYKMGPFI